MILVILETKIPRAIVVSNWFQVAKDRIMTCFSKKFRSASINWFWVLNWRRTWWTCFALNCDSIGSKLITIKKLEIHFGLQLDYTKIPSPKVHSFVIFCAPNKGSEMRKIVSARASCTTYKAVTVLSAKVQFRC